MCAERVSVVIVMSWRSDASDADVFRSCRDYADRLVPVHALTLVESIPDWLRPENADKLYRLAGYTLGHGTVQRMMRKLMLGLPPVIAPVRAVAFSR
jgi:hypothetical protein